ncbi:TetR family transcriptional regulator [Cloacibacterium rupense]|uniref:TetR family transcriptional regulator n=1 Tax=Cloacibacterium rupense TaxID=517423 RepID=A0ABQ2NG08_9FLAO|nr:TetR/AcrR family transcriptional regulator [Cloacibacterium rupense]GGP01568.1 TetR family transcriptional regulator [Cloacibacterium rupense]
MEFQLTFRVNPSLFLRDPDSSEVGKNIVKNSIELMHEIGYENFTFKKLSQYINSTEATIYRYFPNKHKLLLYILNWYWSYLYYHSQVNVKGKASPKDKLRYILRLITNNEVVSAGFGNYDLQKLYEIVISESSKVYLVKDVDLINKEQVFKPYKELCAFVAEIILECKKDYKFSKSLSSTIIETAHYQQYFSMHLPRLTDNSKEVNHSIYVLEFLENFVFDILD